MSTLIALPLVLILLFLASVHVATQYRRAVVFRLGRYSRTAGPGLYFTIPLLERRAITDLRIRTTTVEPAPVRTSLMRSFK